MSTDAEVSVGEVLDETSVRSTVTTTCGLKPCRSAVNEMSQTQPREVGVCAHGCVERRDPNRGILSQ